MREVGVDPLLFSFSTRRQQAEASGTNSTPQVVDDLKASAELQGFSSVVYTRGGTPAATFLDACEARYLRLRVDTALDFFPTSLRPLS